MPLTAPAAVNGWPSAASPFFLLIRGVEPLPAFGACWRGFLLFFVTGGLPARPALCLAGFCLFLSFPLVSRAALLIKMACTPGSAIYLFLSLVVRPATPRYPLRRRIRVVGLIVGFWLPPSRSRWAGGVILSLVSSFLNKISEDKPKELE